MCTLTNLTSTALTAVPLKIPNRLANVYPFVSTPTEHLLRVEFAVSRSLGNTMTEPVADKLSALVPTQDGLKGSAQYKGHDVEISIDFDGCSAESTLALARAIVTGLELNDGKCRRSIAEELLDAYNDGWRSGAAKQPDGSMRAFAYPKLDNAQFRACLTLSIIHVSGDETAMLWYECGDLFWGHSLSITGFDAGRFEDVHVQVVG